MIGLGCMRLSTNADRDDDRGVGVLRAALDAGIVLFDTADAYCLDDRDRGHNERLIGRALAEWNGDRSKITVATKGGMRRPNGAWVADGRGKHLREACEASRRALGVDTIDLYQLHAVDPKTPFATSVRALARLREGGLVRAVGLCNVTVSQIREAQAIVAIESVQVSLSPFDDENLRNGVAEYCRDSGIRLLAHRPLGGDRRKSLARDAAVRAVAERHAATPEEVVLAWLASFGDGVVPLPGATTVHSVASISRAARLELDTAGLRAFDARFAGNLLRVPRARRRPRESAADVVIVMGMPGAGKTTVARELETQGYARLNRDETGGSLAGLAERLDDLLASGGRTVVLDNTYPTRASRNEVIETAWSRGAHVRCIWLTTDIADAQINSIHRMLEAHGELPAPADIRQRSRTDARYLLPDAQFRYQRMLEPPTADEGFVSVEERAFRRAPERAEGRALLLDFDDVAAAESPMLSAASVAVAEQWRATLKRHADAGWRIFVHAWRPQVESGETTLDDVTACFATLRDVLGVDVDCACCSHAAGPPACWCRKPIPGQVIEFAARRGVALGRSIVVGTSNADRTLAARVGARFETPEWLCGRDI